MNIDAAMVYKIVSPFIAGLMASGVTYYFTLRMKTREIILVERLKAFKLLHQKIASLKKYCTVRELERDGSEFAPTVACLSKDDQNSILGHRTEIWSLVEENGIFLSKRSQKAIQALDSQLSLLCNMELSLAESTPLNEIVDSASDGYKVGRQAAEECLDALFAEIQTP